MQNQTLAQRLAPFLKQAKFADKHDPTSAYFCRFYAYQLGHSLIEKYDNPDDQDLLQKLENQIMIDRELLPPNVDGATHITESAMRIFEKAEKDDKSGATTKVTAINYNAAHVLMNVLKLWYSDGLPEEIVERQKYAKMKAMSVISSLKNGGGSANLGSTEEEVSSTPLNFSNQNNTSYESNQPMQYSFQNGDTQYQDFTRSSQNQQTNYNNMYNNSHQDDYDVPPPPPPFEEDSSYSRGQHSDQKEDYSYQNLPPPPAPFSLEHNSNEVFRPSVQSNFSSFSGPQFQINAGPPPYNFSHNTSVQTNHNNNNGYQTNNNDFQMNNFNNFGFQANNLQTSFPHNNMGGVTGVRRDTPAFEKDLKDITKCCKFAVSALNFDDVPTAYRYLSQARNLILRYETPN
eukprot:TRINITY_DN8342_c0_g1_i1.p1 TRINITY_DN8342_c0_g1~~TRINITY_DN8342_c0_g1_i1.p1  ORF type:complete len:402 (-),score=100.22 TRINITY_DN8342_c0_g1_i1:95-1300(-)